jgi:hypothetical protein
MKFSQMDPTIQFTHQNSDVEMDDKRSIEGKVTHILQKVWSLSNFELLESIQIHFGRQCDNHMNECSVIKNECE